MSRLQIYTLILIMWKRYKYPKGANFLVLRIECSLHIPLVSPNEVPILVTVLILEFP